MRLADLPERQRRAEHTPTPRTDLKSASLLALAIAIGCADPTATNQPAKNFRTPNAEKPSATSTALSFPAQAPTGYHVQEGDTPGEISKWLGRSFEEWKRLREVETAQEITDPTRLQVGTVLKWQDGSNISHRVKKGETLAELALRFGIAPDNAVNKLADLNTGSLFTNTEDIPIDTPVRVAEPLTDKRLELQPSPNWGPHATWGNNGEILISATDLGGFWTYSPDGKLIKKSQDSREFFPRMARQFQGKVFFNNTAVPNVPCIALRSKNKCGSIVILDTDGNLDSIKIETSTSLGKIVRLSSFDVLDESTIVASAIVVDENDQSIFALVKISLKNPANGSQIFLSTPVGTTAEYYEEYFHQSVATSGEKGYFLVRSENPHIFVIDYKTQETTNLLLSEYHLPKFTREETFEPEQRFRMVEQSGMPYGIFYFNEKLYLVSNRSLDGKEKSWELREIGADGRVVKRYKISSSANHMTILPPSNDNRRLGLLEKGPFIGRPFHNEKQEIGSLLSIDMSQLH